MALGAMLTALPVRSADAGAVLTEIEAVRRQSFLPGSAEEARARFDQYRGLLRAAGAGDPADPAGQALVRVAREAAREPARLDELVAAYGRWQGDAAARPRVTRPPALETRHQTEAYRPAWEALLLAPPTPEIEFMQRRFTITRALAAIRNPESLPVLELAFAATCAAGVEAVEGSAALDRQFRILETLNQYASRDALQAMFRCLALADGVRPAGPAPAFSGHTLRNWVGRFLTDRDNYGKAAEWREVLRDFPPGNLPAADQALIQQARAGQGL